MSNSTNIAQRLKRLRMSRGLSLDALVASMGHVVTKQALSKYECATASPSPIVLNKLADTFKVKASYFLREPQVIVKFIGYRKASTLPKKDQGRIESLVTEVLEDRVSLQVMTGWPNGNHLPIHAHRISKIEDTERAAEELRTNWKLGQDQISSMVGMLEDHHIHVIEIDAIDKFDGICAVAVDEATQTQAAGLVTSKGVSGERQRLSLAHELGHLVLKIGHNIDEEKAAFRFGAAFLAPAQVVYREIGTKRDTILSEELLLFKKRFGMSVQALVRRLFDLDIISEGYYRHWMMLINRLKWKRKEPGELEPEQSQWLRQTALRAYAEGLISREEVERLLGESLDVEEPLTLIERRAFMKLPLEERRRILSEQAEKLKSHYSEGADRSDLQSGDFVEY
ncbi:helix-turn-helix domain-containing protein [Nitrospira sp. BLG_2]|uniref:helix-turn-helix domain-containing protein n=1 Tax=Nitrospira sp. BLG_2 TaxID=3397507 RepID=UPI003B9B0988